MGSCFVSRLNRQNEKIYVADIIAGTGSVSSNSKIDFNLNTNFVLVFSPCLPVANNIGTNFGHR